MLNRAVIMAELSVGGTFLDWSLYYFSETREFYNPLDDSYNNLVTDPITSTNAHKHNKIHPASFEEFKFCIDQLSNNKNFYSIYPWLGLTLSSNIDVLKFLRNNKFDVNNDWEKYNKELNKELNPMQILFQNYLIEHKLKTVFISNTLEDQLYTLFNSHREQSSSPESEIKLFYNKFFSGTTGKWETSNMWELRENLALSWRPFNPLMHQLNVSLPNSLIYEISSSDMIDRLDLKIRELLTFFKIDQNTKKFDHWQQIYQSWRKLHDIKFHRNWKLILDNIVSGQDHDLSEYDMNITKDAFIQHILLYKYNLSINGYKITNFPTNTKLIHALLEPNPHPLDTVYQEFIKHV